MVGPEGVRGQEGGEEGGERGGCSERRERERAWCEALVLSGEKREGLVKFSMSDRGAGRASCSKDVGAVK